MGGAYSTHGRFVLVRKSEWKRSLRRPRHRWKNNIRIYLREIRIGGVKWVYQSQDRDQ
jgi:hypothetical protein